jgi:hypothetical protein
VPGPPRPPRQRDHPHVPLRRHPRRSRCHLPLRQARPPLGPPR